MLRSPGRVGYLALNNLMSRGPVSKPQDSLPYRPFFSPRPFSRLGSLSLPGKLCNEVAGPSLPSSVLRLLRNSPRILLGKALYWLKSSDYFPLPIRILKSEKDFFLLTRRCELKNCRGQNSNEFSSGFPSMGIWLSPQHTHSIPAPHVSWPEQKASSVPTGAENPLS